MLGVAGGLSILGTSGIVEPMGEQAIVDIAAIQHFEQVLLVGHAGKLVKVAGGIMNTH